MTRLYVRLAGDNDFHCMVSAFVKAVAPRIFSGEWGPDVTKEQIVALFNAYAFSLYALHQHHKVEGADPKLHHHFQIQTKDVYFDSEIDDFDNHNGDGCMASMEHNGIAYYVM